MAHISNYNDISFNGTTPALTEDPTADRTVSVVTNLGIGVLILICILIVYDLLRYFCPRHVFCRYFASNNPANNDYDGTPLFSPALPKAFPLSWVPNVFSYPEETLFNTHGPDVAMFIRFLATQARIFLALSVVTSIVLIPTYTTADSPDLNLNTPGVQGPRGIEKASLANVRDLSPRLWVTLVSEIAVVLIILLFLYYDLVAYTRYRRRYRSDNRRNPSNFAILLMDIPLDQRDEHNIFNHFNAIFPAQVVAVHLVRDAHHLLVLKTRYVSVVNKRQRVERIKASSKLSSNMPSNPPSDLGTPIRTDAIMAMVPQSSAPATPGPTSTNHSPEKDTGPDNKYSTLTAVEIPCPQLTCGFYQNSVTPSAIHTADIPPPDSSHCPDVIDDPKFDVDFTSTKPKTSEVLASNPASHSLAPITSPLFQDRGLKCTHGRPPPHPQPFQMPEPLESDGPNTNIPSTPTSTSAQQRSSLASPRLRALMRSDSDQIVQYLRQADKARNVVVDVERDLDCSAPVTHAAFVVFRNKVAATCAATAPLFPETGYYQISRAPEPRAINWNRIAISRYTTRVRQYATFGILTALTLLWTIPSSFIQGLGNLDSLGDLLEGKKNVVWLRKFVDENRGLARFLEGVLPPLLLFLVLLVVPVLTRFIVSFERIADNVKAEARVRNFLFFFYVMSNFVYQVTIGSFMRELENIIESPRKIVDFLSTSVPTQATFLMKYVIINSFLGSALGMLNVGRLLFRPLFVYRAKTDRDKIQAERIFADYPFAKMYALSMMIALVSYVYATIAPIMNFVAFLYFSIAYTCTKQMLLFTHRPFFEGGGFMFRDAWTGLLIGLYVHQLSMIGIFSLKKAASQAILAILSLILSITFTLHCRRRFFYRIEHGALLDQRIRDEERGNVESALLQDNIPAHFSDMYVHPGLKPVQILEDTTKDPTTAAMGKTCRILDARKEIKDTQPGTSSSPPASP